MSSRKRGTQGFIPLGRAGEAEEPWAKSTSSGPFWLSSNTKLAKTKGNIRLFKEQLVEIERRISDAQSGRSIPPLRPQLEDAKIAASALNEELLGLRDAGVETEMMMQLESDYKTELQKLSQALKASITLSSPRSKSGSTIIGGMGAVENEPSYQSDGEVYMPSQTQSYATNTPDGAGESGSSQPNGQALGISVTDIQLENEKREALRQVEEETRLLGGLFRDVRELVNSQQDVVDTLEDNIEASSLKVGQAHEELQVALKSRKKGRKRKLCFLFLLCLVLTYLFLVYVFPVTRGTNWWGNPNYN